MLTPAVACRFERSSATASEPVRADRGSHGRRPFGLTVVIAGPFERSPAFQFVRADLRRQPGPRQVPLSRSTTGASRSAYMAFTVM